MVENKHVAASGDWYFIHPLSQTGKANIFPVAVWSENDKGSIIGLIGNIETRDEEDPNVARLVPPPPVLGMYIKRSPANSDLIDRAIASGDVDYYELRES